MRADLTATVLPLSLACMLPLAVLAGCGGGGAGAPKPPAANPRAGTATPATAPAAGAAAASQAPGDSWPVSAADSDPNQAEVGGLVFPKPPIWIWATPRNQMRTLQYEVPGRGDGSGAAELVFYLFRGDDGGPIDTNIERWVKQFRNSEGGPADATISVVDIGGLTVHRMEVRGSYQGMGQPAPRPGQMQFGAIVEAPERRVFLRITGPEATVEAAREDFDRMINGIMPRG
ncbi:MAG: hypothetical protein CMJ34_10860 [Phycisphaerae bacterium]|nr:hypothetical protein [Phycisphaerae bacterium]